MCTIVVLRRETADWPLVIAANRDEMAGRPWRWPARHWDDAPWVVAGFDEGAGGTWLGLNDDGVVAGVLNRVGTLGRLDGHRSRGELPLEALSHAAARDAAEALSGLDAAAWRPFNMLIADAREAFWLRGDGRRVTVGAVPSGLSMLTAHDLNDTARSARQRFHRPRFEALAPPDPERADWAAWEAALASPEREPGAEPAAAMCFATESGFGTLCGSLIALPRPGGPGRRPIWRFAAGGPGRMDSRPLDLE